MSILPQVASHIDKVAFLQIGLLGLFPVAWVLAAKHDRRVDDVDGIYTLIAKHRKTQKRMSGIRCFKCRLLKNARKIKAAYPDKNNVVLKAADATKRFIQAPPAR